MRTSRLWPLTAMVLVATACGSASRHSATPSLSTSGTASAPGTTNVVSQTPAPIENNPPGDIADNVAYVRYANSAGHYSFLHPEGWASVVHGPAVTFTDKLNGITATATGAVSAPTLARAQQEIGTLRSSQPAFELRSTKLTTLPAGKGILIVFSRNSVPDPLTGKVFRDEVDRYEIYAAGRLITLDLYGAVGSDNVDPYRKISQSLRLS